NPCRKKLARMARGRGYECDRENQETCEAGIGLGAAPMAKAAMSALSASPPRDDAPAEGRIQQAKKLTKRAQVLQIVPKRTTRRKEHKLTRVAFRVSRLMEFCTTRELQNQTGHAVYDWPLVVLKELMDNALDACEEAEVAPVISITVGHGSITIQDNANG